MEIACTRSAVFLVPWIQFGTILELKMEQEAVPEAAWTSLGSIFWRLGGGEKPSKSWYAAEATVFSQFWCSKTRQDDFHGVLGPPIMGIFGINRVLELQKVSPITSSGREPKFWWKSDWFWIGSSEQNQWFYNGFIVVFNPSFLPYSIQCLIALVCVLIPAWIKWLLKYT